MKKLIVLLVLFAAFVYGDVVGTYTDAIPEWDFNLSDTVTTARDTLSGATDSVVLFSKFVPERGWEYILSHAAMHEAGGGTADSLKIRLLIRSWDWNDVVICSTLVDTVASNDGSGSAYLIPFGTGTLFGKSYDIIFQTYTGAGNSVVINRCMLFRRRPITYRKNWK